jgi:hypothetical protein
MRAFHLTPRSAPRAIVTTLFALCLAPCACSDGDPRVGQTRSTIPTEAGAGGSAAKDASPPQQEKGTGGDKGNRNDGGTAAAPSTGGAANTGGAGGAEPTKEDAGENEPADAGAEAGPKPLTPLDATTSYEGRTLEEWVVEWARWRYAQTTCDDPFFDEDGSICALYQDPASPVFFLAKGTGDPVRTKCRIPSGKAILVPLTNLLGDNAGVPPEALMTEEEMRATMLIYVQSMRELVLRVDGQEIQNLERYSIGPTKYSYVVPPPPNAYSCSGMDGVEGLVDPAFAGGTFVLLPPSTKGEHTVVHGGTGTLFGTDFGGVASSTFVVE